MLESDDKNSKSDSPKCSLARLERDKLSCLGPVNDILTPNCTHTIKCSDKSQVLKLISKIAAEHLKMKEKDIYDALIKRENIGSTGVGDGVAIPHGHLPAKAPPIGVFLRLEKAIAFDALDKRPVDIIFAVLLPKQHCKMHLKSIASIAKQLVSKGVRKRLKSAKNDQELYDIIVSCYAH